MKFMGAMFLGLCVMWCALSQHPHMHDDIYVALIYFIAGVVFLLTPSK